MQTVPTGDTAWGGVTTVARIVAAAFAISRRIESRAKAGMQEQAAQILSAIRTKLIIRLLTIGIQAISSEKLNRIHVTDRDNPRPANGQQTSFR